MLRRLLASALCISSLVAAQSSSAQVPLQYGSKSAEASNPVADLGYARYKGIQVSTLGVDAYYGIRYAAPPTHNNRFRAPLPIEQHNNYESSKAIDATKSGPSCIQAHPPWMLPPSSPIVAQAGEEDCLLLDVLVPSKPARKKLPVWVQIHGGGYDIGYTSAYPGFALVNQSQGEMIFVSIQYRLNAFGFLASSEIKEDGTANAGILDQRAALDWIQRHIASFGGDPSRVTVSGNSAGGSSVVNQLILHGGSDTIPFYQAIAEYPWWQPYHDDTILEAQYREVLAAANCTDLACLRKLDSTALNIAATSALVSAYDKQAYGYGDFYYGPAVDGSLIRDLPSNELKAGHFAKVPLLVDREGYEGAIFSNASQTTKPEELADLELIFPSAGKTFFSRLSQLYPDNAFNSTYFQRQQLFGDFIINCPTRWMADAFTKAGMDVWKMVFDAGTQVHGSTAPFLFSTDPTAIGNVTLGLIMKDWFLGFAVHGDPNAKSYSGVKKDHWAKYTENAKVMGVNYTEIGVLPDPDEGERCEWWFGEAAPVRN